MSRAVAMQHLRLRTGTDAQQEEINETFELIAEVRGGSIANTKESPT
jgi:hypothetical protein